MTINRRYVTDGLTAATPFLLVSDIPAAIAFYVRVFGAVEVRQDPDPAGLARHAVLRIDDAPIELGRHADVARAASTALPPVGVHLFVPDVDAVWAAALAAGATGRPPADMPYGERAASVLDPFGITWWVATSRAATSTS